MKGKVGWWWNKIFMEIFRRYLTVVWIAKPFVLKSFVFSFFVPVWNSLLNLWLFFMSFVATSSYVIVSRPCRLSESYLNPLNPKIKIWILICCPYTFLIKAVVRSCWSINSLCLVWSCPYISSPICFIKHRYHKKNFDTDHSLGLKG